MKHRSQVGKTNLKSPSANRNAVIERLKRRTTGAGSFSAPCIPALYEHYLAKLLKLFEVMDRPLAAEELGNFQRSLRTSLEQGFRASPHARFILWYRPVEANPVALECSLDIVTPSLEEQYQEWLASTGQEHPFGSNPDARVMDVARAISNTQSNIVLDVGAGTGRNSLPLARLGLRVEAMEPVPELASQIREVADRDNLPVTVLEDNVLLDTHELRAEHYRLIVMSEVTPHFSRADMQSVIPRLTKSLMPQGILLLNAFVAKSGYNPDAVAEQAAQCVWSTFYTRRDLNSLSQCAGLELVSDELCTTYEMDHLPSGAWPPTSWYENWASGHNLFAITAGPAPIELRWLEFRRRSTQ